MLRLVNTYYSIHAHYKCELVAKGYRLDLIRAEHHLVDGVHLLYLFWVYLYFNAVLVTGRLLLFGQLTALVFDVPETKHPIISPTDNPVLLFLLQHGSPPALLKFLVD